MKNEEIYKVSDLYVVRVFETEKSYKSFICEFKYDTISLEEENKFLEGTNELSILDESKEVYTSLVSGEDIVVTYYIMMGKDNILYGSYKREEFYNNKLNECKLFNDLNYKVKNLVRNEEFYDWEMLSDIVKLDSVEFLTKEEIKVLESELNKRFALVRK